MAQRVATAKPSWQTACPHGKLATRRESERSLRGAKNDDARSETAEIIDKREENKESGGVGPGGVDKLRWGFKSVFSFANVMLI